MDEAYNSAVEAFREDEYPMLQDSVYLDHAGTTLYSKSLMEKFMGDMMSNLYGNPHSASPSSQLSTNRIEDTRLKALQFFGADPEQFDIVFVANATAGIKMVTEAFKEQDGGFAYAYHQDSHTSLVGVRELASSKRCLCDDEVECWLSGPESLIEETKSAVNLFAYPAQSNMDGRRLPLSWCGRARQKNDSPQYSTYTLLDASALVSTAQLDLKNHCTAPDFTVLSFYKIFGFPDLGALIVRKESGAILQQRKYFGGGTVDVVLCIKEQWHAPKSQSVHAALEDGTLPFHNILALDAAIDVHEKLYGTMDKISRHTAFLAQKLHDDLASLRHATSTKVCVMQSDGFASNEGSHGPTVAFNIKNSHGAWISNTEFEKLASVRKFHLRSGGLCNPGGVAKCLNLEPWEMRKNFSAGFKCGSESDIHSGKITGVIRASLGAMSTIGDVNAFVSFVREFYAEIEIPHIRDDHSYSNEIATFAVESISIYPIKSCGEFQVPSNTPWEVRPEGLAWDREWCLVHLGTGQALTQKRHPRMALISPVLDFQKGLLRIQYRGARPEGVPEEVRIPLSSNPEYYQLSNESKLPSRVCGDAIRTCTYTSPGITEFFSAVLGVPCVLARFPAGGTGLGTRYLKAHLQKAHPPERRSLTTKFVPGAFQGLPSPPDSDCEAMGRPILLSNESPILAVNKASLVQLNEAISMSGGKPASASVFRANIVLTSPATKLQQAYSEDHWKSVLIGQQKFQVLGPCRRCHMICIDQNTAEKNEEPFVTLAKTRRFESKVYFGSHMCHVPLNSQTKESQFSTISVGDDVIVSARDGV